MCERYSWLTVDGKTVFLTAKDVFHTQRGKDLQRHSQRQEDWYGHGAIRWYYDIPDNTGTECECTDFSTTMNFPTEIVDAIKAGEMRELGITGDMLVMLGKRVQVKYGKAIAPANAEYYGACSAALAKRDKDCIAVLAKYGKACSVADAKYDKACSVVDAEYYKARDAACAKYDKACSVAFANLFSNPENRIREWR